MLRNRVAKSLRLLRDMVFVSICISFSKVVHLPLLITITEFEKQFGLFSVLLVLYLSSFQPRLVQGSVPLFILSPTYPWVQVPL